MNSNYQILPLAYPINEINNNVFSNFIPIEASKDGNFTSNLALI